MLINFKMKSSTHIHWSTKMLDYLKDNYQTKTNKELADALGLKITSTRTKLYELGYKRIEMEYWTEEQIAFLKSNYQQMGDTEIAEIFNKQWKKNKPWTRRHIDKKRNYLKLDRTIEELQKIKDRNIETGRFSICPVRAWDTIGRTPNATLKVWKSKNEAPIVVIKLAEGFIHYKPYLWKQNFGEIPSNMCVRTKDNSFNIIPENLELVTRAENARRNTIIRKQHKDYKELYKEAKRTIRKLNKTLIKQERITARAEAKKQSKLLSVSVRFNEEKQFAIKQVDYSQLIPIRIDAKTVIYAKSGDDIELVKSRYIKNREMYKV